MNQNNSNSPPIVENEYVKQLFHVLNENGKDTSGLASLLSYIGEMEKSILQAENNISEMKSLLADFTTAQNQPLKKLLINCTKNLKHKTRILRGHLSELKHQFIKGCQSTMQAFKEKGISELHNLASFFQIKSDLKLFSKNINRTIKATDKTIAKIEAFSNEYHTAERTIKNMARILANKEPLATNKKTGILAKAIVAPYKTQKAVMIKLKKLVNQSIMQLDTLEKTAVSMQKNRSAAKSPSLLGELEATQKLVEKNKPKNHSHAKNKKHEATL